VVNEKLPARVCISILNWNNAEETLKCLSSLPAPLGFEQEIVVLDNGSIDSSLEVLGKINTITLLRSDSNLGFAGGHNRVMRHALEQGFDYVWLLNNDAEVEADCLARLVEAAQRDPGLGLLSPAIKDRQQPERYQHVLSLLNATGTGVEEYPEPERAAEMQQRHPQRILLWGTGLLVRRQLIEQIGYLDERLFAYNEDTDYSLRCLASGYRNLVVIDAAIRHEVAPAVRKPHYYYYTQRNMTLMWRKFVGPLQLLRMIRWNLHLARRQLDRFKGDPALSDSLILGIWHGWTGRGGCYQSGGQAPAPARWLIQLLLQIA
jgi:GT2 family glycosyltransferase